MPAQRPAISRSSRRYTGAERRSARPSIPALCVALAVFAAIAFATLCPPELRPHLAAATLAGATAERFGAYFLLGLCMAFAFPRRANLVVFGVTGIALALEAGQLLVPGRDAVFADACVKAMGGLWGVFVAQTSYAAVRLLRRRLRPRRIHAAGATRQLMRGAR